MKLTLDILEIIDKEQKKGLNCFYGRLETFDIKKENLGSPNKREPQGHNLKLTLDIFELILKSEKKGLRQFFDKSCWKVKKSLLRPA